MGDPLLKSELWPADNPAVTAHLAMLQGVITRLAANSASCKTWCLTLVGALLSFAAGIKSPAVAAFAIVPILIFAFLDMMYLAQERAYRTLFTGLADKVRDGSYQLTDSFITAAEPLTARDIAKAVRSWSIWPVYLTLLIAYCVAILSGPAISTTQGESAKPSTIDPANLTAAPSSVTSNRAAAPQ